MADQEIIDIPITRDEFRMIIEALEWTLHCSNDGGTPKTPPIAIHLGWLTNVTEQLLIKYKNYCMGDFNEEIFNRLKHKRTG